MFRLYLFGPSSGELELLVEIAVFLFVLGMVPASYMFYVCRASDHLSNYQLLKIDCAPRS
jgi:hypothetical protein